MQTSNPLFAAVFAGAAGADDFTGTFEGTAIAIELRLADGEYAGTLSFQGEDYPVTARRDGDTLTPNSSGEGRPRVSAHSRRRGKTRISPVQRTSPSPYEHVRAGGLARSTNIAAADTPTPPRQHERGTEP